MARWWVLHAEPTNDAVAKAPAQARSVRATAGGVERAC